VIKSGLSTLLDIFISILKCFKFEYICNKPTPSVHLSIKLRTYQSKRKNSIEIHVKKKWLHSHLISERLLNNLKLTHVLSELYFQCLQEQTKGWERKDTFNFIFMSFFNHCQNSVWEYYFLLFFVILSDVVSLLISSHLFLQIAI